MDAVACTVDVAAKQPLVRLHQLGRLLRDRMADRAGKAPIAPEAPDVERIADHRLDELQARLRPLSRVERYRDATLEQCLERAFDETLSASVRRVALADDGQAHYAPLGSVAASMSVRAACTRSTGSVVRHSEILPPPQPSMPQGRHGCAAEATTRWATPQGPHSISPLGPNSATTGVPIAAAICMGAESTPTKARASRVSAANSRRLSAPVRSTMREREALAHADRIASTSARSRASGAPVTAMRMPAAVKRSSKAAECSGGQHLNSQREPGCIWMKRCGSRPCCASRLRTRAADLSSGHSTSRLSAGSGCNPMRLSAWNWHSAGGRGVVRGGRKK